MVNFLNKIVGKLTKHDWGPGQSLNEDRSNEAALPGGMRNPQQQGVAAVPTRHGGLSEAAARAREAALARIEAQRQRNRPQRGGIIDRQIAVQRHEEQNIEIIPPRHDEVIGPQEGESADEQMEGEELSLNNSYGHGNINRNFPRDNGSGDGSNGSIGETDDRDVSMTDNSFVLESKVKSVNFLMQKQLYKFIIGRLDIGSYTREYDLDFNYNCRSPEECHQEDLRRIAAIDYQLSELTDAGTLDVTHNPHFEDMDYLLLKILFPNFTTLYICMRKEDKLNYLIRHLRDILTYDLPFFLEIPVSPLKKKIKSEDNNLEVFKIHGLFPCGLVYLKYDNEIQDQIEAANEGKEFDYVKPNF
ncbi:Hypothetical protein SRAE_X000036900 [Strongyloides ratti]|uniref:Uncharacterized protein n=1 Tax=Strongyloides ratti TaxID=34506 RepID=A0A090LS54_STRRB|nr:Hypothetical protein SRAE_X000036900 [Strongyloides ratti]CEF71042.1 Hypothetical protein SRAE_X000036900 [Strongyloides ratti]